MKKQKPCSWDKLRFHHETKNVWRNENDCEYFNCFDIYKIHKTEVIQNVYRYYRQKGQEIQWKDTSKRKNTKNAGFASMKSFSTAYWLWSEQYGHFNMTNLVRNAHQDIVTGIKISRFAFFCKKPIDVINKTETIDYLSYFIKFVYPTFHLTSFQITILLE